jgi:histidyl-tRNA synthetase
MFRYERPQEGRQRQFLQMGVECIGSPSPLVDAEVMALGAEFYSSIGLEPELLLNSMGCAADRAAYGPKLREELESKRQALCEDCHARLDANPLRVFDCKVPSCREVLEDVTPLSGFLCHECREHLSRVRELLKSIGVPWRDAPELVRGFDYYTRTIFEFDLASLGARSAVGGGGRYDGLVEEMGGPSLPAAGMAVGVEPVLVALRNTRSVEEQAWRPDVYVAWLDQEQSTLAMTTGAALRERGMRVIVADEAKSLKAQLRAADRYGAARAVILGPQDVSRGVATVRDLAAATQEEIALDDLPARLGRHG